jgi:hypothetical protein
MRDLPQPARTSREPALLVASANRACRCSAANQQRAEENYDYAENEAAR